MNNEVIIERVCLIRKPLPYHLENHSIVKKLAEEILSASPTEEFPEYPSFDYLANQCEMLDDELDEGLNRLNLKVVRLFLINEKRLVNDLLIIDPKQSTSFYLNLKNGQTLAFRIPQHIQLEIGEKITHNMFPEELKDKAFQVKNKEFEMNFSELSCIYFIMEIHEE